MAEANLDYWLGRLEQGLLQRQSQSSWQQQGVLLAEAAKTAHPRSHRLATRRMLQLAEAVEDQLGQGVDSDEILEELIDYLRKAAAANHGEKCPWSHLLPKLKGRQAAVANTLWKLNRNKSTEWEVRLHTFVEHVWGQFEPKDHTVGTAISRFVGFLKNEGIDFQAKVNNTSYTPTIKCKFRRRPN